MLMLADAAKDRIWLRQNLLYRTTSRRILTIANDLVIALSWTIAQNLIARSAINRTFFVPPLAGSSAGRG